MSQASARQLDFEDLPGTLLTPPLKWAGGKRWLVPRLRLLYKKHSRRRLVEPFVGGAAAALGLRPSRALLSDVSPHLINFYKWLKRGLTIDIEMLNDRDCFLGARLRFNQLVKDRRANTKEAASLFYYLNRTGFNGLCRFNSSGQFNVPFGKYATINYVRNFSTYKRAFKHWQFVQTDFEKLPVTAQDFLYIDPPYDVEFTRYAKDDFTWDDQLRLVEWLKGLRCPIVASNQASDRILRLYKRAGFTVEQISAPRRIACNGNRDRAQEILAFKNLNV